MGTVAKDGKRDLIRYQDFVSMVRRYDRDQLLLSLAQVSTQWRGRIYDADGKMAPFRPWDIAGVASVVIGRGTSGKRQPDVRDLRLLCDAFSRLEHPGDDIADDYAYRLISRFAYQQVPYQADHFNSLARTSVLFAHTNFPEGRSPRVMSPGWDKRLYGCSIDVFLSVGFMLRATAMANKGLAFPIDWLGKTTALRAALGGDAVVTDVISKHFAAPLVEFKQRRRAHIDRWNLTSAEAYRFEPWAVNFLAFRPLIGGIYEDRLIAPCVPVLDLRTSATSVILDGMRQWGSDFASDTGHLFEQYVGNQLADLAPDILVPEISYREKKQEKKSIDWFLVLPDVVFLFECKTLRPNASLMEGQDSFLDEHAVLSQGIDQLNRTAALIKADRPEFNEIPNDRPRIGILVTLGAFLSANDTLVRDRLSTPDIPTAILDIELLEGLVGCSEEELNELGVRVSEHVSSNNAINVSTWLNGTTKRTNALLEQAFDKLPVVRVFEEIVGQSWREAQRD
ncbi:hypothetical protein [Leucobacter sp. 1207-22]|uniref:hypothetical protein n=1 Tax=Leucobacter sp. 1207-22 TaxID=2604456 RepID=UPI004063F52A